MMGGLMQYRLTNETKDGVRIGALALVNICRDLMDAAVDANDSDAYTLAVGTYSKAAAFIGERGIDDPDDAA